MIRRGAWLLMPALIIVTSCGGPQKASPPVRVTRPSPSPSADRAIDVSALTGRIVFSAEDDIWLVNADGTGLTRLTTRRGAEFDPTWSPNGIRIAYRDSRRGINNDDEIYVMKADGSGQANLTRNPADDWGPAWSPNGTSIAFSSTRDTGSIPQIFLMDPDGSNVRRLTEIEGEYPTWSPDGTRIAFMSLQSGPRASTPEYEIFVMNAVGTDLRRLTHSPGEDGWPAWSAGGTAIAFSSARDDHGQFGEGPFFQVFVMNVDGTGLRKVGQEFGQFPTWSPDGRLLLVSPGGYLTTPDGSASAPMHLPPQASDLAFADWTS
jgi:Tol biopolymer transport system component